MASVISKGQLYPEVASNELINLVRGKSSLARLSGQNLIPFNGQREFVFALDNEVDIVAENGAKSNGGGTVTAKTIVPIKFEYGLRVSDEFVYGSEEIRLQYLRQFNEGFANKISRGIDIAAMHGLNPRTKSASTVVGDNNLDKAITNSVTKTTNADTDIDSAVALVEGAEHEVTGIVVSPSERAALAALRSTSGERLYPELAWGKQPEDVNGLAFDVNSTVSFNTEKELAYVGNFRDYFKLGYGKDITFEVIEYGNPDNDTTAGDLKGHNQVYLRAEAYIGWAILDPTAFAKIVSE